MCNLLLMFTGWTTSRLEGECLFRPIPATGHGPANDGELNAKKGSRGKVCGGWGLKTGGGGV